MKRIGQREANRKALEMAAAMVADADFDSLFGEDFGDYDSERDQDILAKAQAYASKRIRGLTTP